MISQKGTENWLQRYVSDAVSRRLCTMIGCTTCGAHKFRSGLVVRVAGSDTWHFNADGAKVLLDLMSELKPPEHASLAWERAIRLMVHDCWSDLGGDSALPLMQHRLGQSWAGHVLRKMIAHEEQRRRARQEHEARSIMAQEERMQRKQERRLRHESRLLQKKQRDKVWWINSASRIRSEI